MPDDTNSEALLPRLDGTQSSANQGNGDPTRVSLGERLKRVAIWLVLLALLGGLITGTVLLFKERWDLVLQFWLLGAAGGVVAGIFLLKMERQQRDDRESLEREDTPANGSPSNATLVYARVFLWMSMAIAVACIIGLTFPLERKLFCVSIFAFVFAMLCAGMISYCVKTRHWMGALAFLIMLVLVLNALGAAWLDWPFIPVMVDPIWLARIAFGAVVLAALAMLPIYKSNQGQYTRVHVTRAYVAIVLGVVFFAVTWVI